MTYGPHVRIRGIDARPVLVPMRRPLRTSRGAVEQAPTRHWLEYVDWAAPVLREPLAVEDGHAVVPDRPGAGLEWDEEAVSLFGFEG